MHLYRGLLTIVVVASLYCLPAAAQPTRGTVAFVDYEQVFTNFYKTKLANDQLKQMHASYIEIRQSYIEELNAMIEQYKSLRDQSVDKEVEEEKRNESRRRAEKKLAEIRQQEKKIKNHDETHETKVEDQRKRIRIRYGDEIKERVRGYAISKDYSAIIDYTIMTDDFSPGVLYYNKEADITADIIKEINK